jgi:hypothetical protein
VFNRQFLTNALEVALVTGASTFAGSQVFTGGSVSLHGLESAGIAAATAALYTFVKALGAKQAAAAASKG